MTFELELGEIRLWCSSPECTRKLVEKGARFVNPAQAEQLSRLLGSPIPLQPTDPRAATSH